MFGLGRKERKRQGEYQKKVRERKKKKKRKAMFLSTTPCRSAYIMQVVSQDDKLRSPHFRTLPLLLITLEVSPGLCMACSFASAQSLLFSVTFSDHL